VNIGDSERDAPTNSPTVTVYLKEKNAGVAQTGCELGMEGAKLGLVERTSRVELQERLLHALEERDEAKRRLGEALAEIERLKKELTEKGMVNQRNERGEPLLLESQAGGAKGQEASQSNSLQSQAADSQSAEEVGAEHEDQRAAEVERCGSGRSRHGHSQTESIEERASVKGSLDELRGGEQQIQELGSGVSILEDEVESPSLAAKGAGADAKGSLNEALRAIEMERGVWTESKSSLAQAMKNPVSDLGHQRIESRSIEDAKREDGGKDAHKLQQRVRIEGPKDIESIGVAAKLKPEGSEILKGHGTMVE
jgi:hypothetical protein